MTSPASGASSTFLAQLVVVDASVWISNLLAHDRNHTSAVTWINNHLVNGGKLVAPVMLTLETAGAVARIAQNQSLAHQITLYMYLLPSLQLVPIDQFLLDEAVDIATTFSLKGPDALYVAVAKQLAIPLMTFDHE
ncbi:MAG TPA: PIN domain-containing protein [Chloroflexia bacterium]|nr:PIN domain-containing protein [Chloroflexia bacterium]